MAQSVLVDSSALVACFSRRDQSHGRARHAMRELERQRATLLVPDFVLGEVATCFKRMSFDACRVVLERLKALRESAGFDLIQPDLQEVMDASSVIFELPDPDFTCFDALLVAMARRRGIARVFSFDRAFAALGFPSV